jgi:hypothetical protein
VTSKAIISFFILLLVSRLPIAAQDSKRLAVIPFNFVDVSLRETEPIFAAFEDALGRTGAYSVIGRDEITAALESMGLGLFDCTSEKCAADLALRVSTDFWVVGVLAGRESGFLLKAKVVEAASGRILYLDSITARSLDNMRQSLELFAFKLAGLTTTVGKVERIAREFGEVFIETDPARSEIYINGVRKGISPDIIRSVPLGRVRIAAQFGSLFGEKTIEITKNLQQVRLALSENPGSLQLAGGANLDLYLDGSRSGPIGSGILAGLAPGVHTVELQGQGMYWRDELLIRANERTIISAQPRPYGAIQYELPQGAVAEILGERIREAVTGYGTLPVPAGRYSATVTGRNYENVEGILISVAKEATTLLRPELQFSMLFEQEQFTRRIEEADRAVGYGYLLAPADVIKLKELKQSISQSRHGFPDLVSQVESLIERAETIVAAEAKVVAPGAGDMKRQENERRLNELMGQKQQLELQIESRRLEGKRKATGGWISFGAGLATGGLAGLFQFLANDAYREYEESYQIGSWEQAQRKEDEVRLWDISTIAALGASGVCIIISSVLWVSRPPTRELSRELQSITKQIELLGQDDR